MFQRENDFMKQFSREAEQIMMERFGKDTIISLATTENATPYVRYVNAYYENGSFYIITHALSNKMITPPPVENVFNPLASKHSLSQRLTPMSVSWIFMW